MAQLGHRKRILEAIAAMEGQPEVVSVKPASASPVPMSPSVERFGEPGRHREAERRQLTVMFVDLVGSTALARRLDPEEMRDLLRQFQNTTAGEVLRFEWHVAKLMGDGALAYFGWPQAHGGRGCAICGSSRHP
ncbi:adenylate/guanylate cyclase domain-containing protein [Mesorhizobium sp.]|uniref:adenylate/guanylate cyclase domain-containing protein n=1 Tax=Mesorhizobium sp. TaxID=1871066 RepID=UPI000FE58B78|nr:adenylate/guanylate cyclase domain-containing protein [Mesorhizobium sp.]RWO20394.1 MAG: adenylate/guanylate cyclase domain-containing protein [Mesorhizobium sp.]